MTDAERLAFLRLARLASTTSEIGVFDLDLAIQFERLREAHGLATFLVKFREAVLKEREDELELMERGKL